MATNKQIIHDEKSHQTTYIVDDGSKKSEVVVSDEKIELRADKVNPVSEIHSH